MALEQVRERLEGLRGRVRNLSGSLKIESKLAELKQLEARREEPGFWERPDEAQKVEQQIKRGKSATTPFVDAGRALEDQGVLLDLAAEAADEATMAEV